MLGFESVNAAHQTNVWDHVGDEHFPGLSFLGELEEVYSLPCFWPRDWWRTEHEGPSLTWPSQLAEPLFGAFPAQMWANRRKTGWSSFQQPLPSILDGSAAVFICFLCLWVRAWSIRHDIASCNTASALRHRRGTEVPGCCSAGALTTTTKSQCFSLQRENLPNIKLVVVELVFKEFVRQALTKTWQQQYHVQKQHPLKNKIWNNNSI